MHSECLYTVTAGDIAAKFKRFKDGAVIVSPKTQSVVLYFRVPKDVRSIRVTTKDGEVADMRATVSNTLFKFGFVVCLR